MDFTEEEAEIIAYSNISQILNHKGITYDYPGTFDRNQY